MNIISYPERSEWPALLTRPVQDSLAIEGKVLPILDLVKTKGDEGLCELAKKFDGVELAEFAFSQEEFDAAEGQLDEELKAAIRQAYQNIYTFHKAQLQPAEKIETMPALPAGAKA